MLSDFLLQDAKIEVESPQPGTLGQDDLGGADRTAWQAVVDGIPCLVRRLSASMQVRSESRGQICDTRIYFADDPVPEGLGSRHRVIVDGSIYHVKGAVDPNSMGRLLEVDCELMRFP